MPQYQADPPKMLPLLAATVLVFAAAAICPCDAGALSGVSISLSSYISNSTNVSLTLSFRVASESAVDPIMYIQLTSLPGSEAELTIQSLKGSSCFCTNLNPYAGANASRIGSDMIISLFNAATAVVPSNPVVCVMGLFSNSPSPSIASPAVNISTLFNNSTVIDKKAGVDFPALFSASSLFASVTISHNVAGLRANVSFSFRSSSRNANAQFKTISVSGLRFSSYDSSTNASCTGLDSTSVYVAQATYTPDIGVFLIVLSSAASASMGLNCTTNGFTNPSSSQHLNCSLKRLDFPQSFCFGTVPSGTFADTIPVHYMLDDELGTFVWVAVKHVPSTFILPASLGQGPEEDANYKRLPLEYRGVLDAPYYFAQSRLQQLASAAVDMYMREDASQVSAIMTSPTAYNTVKQNIAAGKPFFKGIPCYRQDLSPWMRPSPSTKLIPDVDAGTNELMFWWTEDAQFRLSSWSFRILHSSGSIYKAATSLNSFWRMNGGDYRTYKINTVWFKVPALFAPPIQISTLDALSAGIDTKSDVRMTSALVSFNFIGSQQALVPTTSNTLISLFMSSAPLSGRVRLGVSSCRETIWNSDSLVQCRTASGITKSPNLVVTVTENLYQATAAKANVSYNHAPVVANVSGRVEDILVTGAGFGDYVAVVSRETICSNATSVMAQHSAILCSLDLSQSLGDITEASFSIVLGSIERLDDVSIAVVNPKNVQFALIEKKCFGCTATAGVPPTFSVVFNVPSLPGSSEIPDTKCESGKNYKPLSLALLASNFQSSDARGVWSLVVTTGSSSILVSSVRMFFKTSVLTGVIGATKAISMSWTSDSSIKMCAPGMLKDSDNISSAAGWGRNHTVAVRGESNASQANLVYYSYPDPFISNVSVQGGDWNLFQTTGSAGVLLTGRYFSNSQPRIRATLQPSVCAGTVWTSDTCLRCALPAIAGSSTAFIVSVESSVVASLLLNASAAGPLVFQSISNVSQLAIVSQACSPGSSVVAVRVLGSAFGLRGFSAASRLMLRASSAAATFWTSDSQLLSKCNVLHRGAGDNGMIVSVASTQAFLTSPTISMQTITLSTGSSVDFFPTTGSSFIFVRCSSLGTVSASVQSRFGGSAGQLTRWTSDSSFSIKSSSKTILAPSRGQVVASVSKTMSNQPMPAPIRRFALPFSNLGPNSFINNTLSATDCLTFFDSPSQCRDGTTISLNNGSGGFGTAFALFQLNVQQGLSSQLCNASRWLSDSSIHCQFVPEISFRFSSIAVGGLLNDGGVQAARDTVSLKNPYFIAASPLLNQSISCRLFSQNSSSTPSNSLLADFARVGNSSGIVWNTSSVSRFYEYAEAIPLEIFVFINAEQYYLDAKLAPITTLINITVSVFEASADVTSQVLCRFPPATSFQLPASSFYAVTSILLRSCSIRDYNDTKLLVAVSVSNVNGAFTFNETSASFALRGPSPAALRIVDSAINSTGSIFYAGSQTGYLFTFRFNFSGSLNERCEYQGAGTFSYTMSLSCGVPGNATLFRSFGGNLVAAVEVNDCPFCVQNVSDILFIRANKMCVFNVSVPSRAVYVVSQPFAVAPGPASAATLLGSGPFCLSAGSQIYSMNTSFSGVYLLCLAAQLVDAQGNNVSEPVRAALVAKTSQGVYRIARSNVSVSDSSGIALWCDAFSSVADFNISIGVQILSSSVTTWFPTLLNVSGVGPAGGLLPANLSGLGVSGVLPGAAPKIVFNLLDAGGNALSGSSGSLVIRIRVISSKQRSNSTPIGGSGRRLLQTAAASQCEGDLETLVAVSNGSSSVAAGPAVMCTAGVNVIVYDIGTNVNGQFLVAFSNVFSVDVTVFPGPFDSFVLMSVAPINTTSYTLIDSLRVIFRDSGLNVVSGTASMSLVCTNTSAILFPREAFNVTCNSSVSQSAAVPEFYISVSDWRQSQPLQTLEIHAVNSSVRAYGASSVLVTLRPVCGPGSYISPTVLSRSPFQLNATCIACDQSTHSSWQYDSPSCLTLKWDLPPTVVASGKLLGISGIRAAAHDGSTFTRTASWRVEVSLLRTTAPGSVAGSCSCLIQNGISVSASIAAPLYIQAPATDYRWRLLLFADDLLHPVLNSTFPSNATVTVLDFQPVIIQVAPLSVSYVGGDVFTIVGSFPRGLAAQSFAEGFVRDVQPDACLFTPPQSSGLSIVKLPANRTSNSVNITFVCSPFPATASRGSAAVEWLLSMSLSDGRDSSGSISLKSVCPAGHYIPLLASSGPCLQCPAGSGVIPKSTSLSSNSVGLSSCVCNRGYYGSFGDGCSACPAVNGIDCRQTNISKPLVLPGFFIDYSLLSKCSEFSTKCDAIIECPNAAACPGGGEKRCRTTTEECYSDMSFGCTTCCPSFYIDNLKCLPCPPSQLPLLLGLATLALILFAVVSASFDFPPVVSAVQSFRIILGALQSYVSIRLISIQWPDIVLKMFDFTRFFMFSFDVIRPECTVSYSPQSKLIFVLVGPVVCISFIALMTLVYAAFKGVRISSLLHKKNNEVAVYPHIALKWSFVRTLKSVFRCMIVSTFSTQFDKSRLLTDAVLWNALDPALMTRSDITVVRQRLRRSALVGATVTDTKDTLSAHILAIPDDWRETCNQAQQTGLQDEFSRSTKRIRLLVASAFSIFIFIYQGSLETFFSSFDCSSINSMSFLRSNPTIQCDLQDSRYLNLVIVSCAGVFVYCILLPLLTMLTMRSLWIGNMIIHCNMGYSQMFGFLTSQYSNRYPSWELVMSVRKVVFVGIPVFLSRDPLVQSVALFVFLLLYTFLIVKFQPMSNQNLNGMEIISCISIIIGAFASIFFSVEYRGQLLLSGPSRDFVGLVFVIVCASAAASAIRLLCLSFSELLLMHKDIAVLNWVLEVKQRLGESCKNGVFVPLVCMFFNDVSSADVLKRKRHLVEGLDAINRPLQEQSNSLFCACYSVSAWYRRLRLRLRFFASKPAASAVAECVSRPEFDFLQWLYKLSERCKAWRKMNHGNTSADARNLPQHLHEVLGEADPPLSSYARCVQVVDMLESILPGEMCRTLTGLMFSVLMDEDDSRSQFRRSAPDGSTGKNGYDRRIKVKLSEFVRTMSKIFAIYQRLQELEAEERARLPWISRLWRRYQKPSLVVLNKLSELRAENVLDIVEDALRGALANKQQEAFRREMAELNLRAARAKPLNPSSSRSSARVYRQQVHPTASGASAAAADAAGGRSAPAAQRMSATRKKSALGQQPHEPEHSGSSNIQHLNAALTLNSRVPAASRSARSHLTSPAFGLEEVVVHRAAAISSADQDRSTVATHSSLPPSPPPEVLFDSASSPSKASTAPPSRCVVTAAADSVNIRAIVDNAGSAQCEDARVDTPPCVRFVSTTSARSSDAKPMTGRSRAAPSGVSPNRRSADISESTAAVTASAHASQGAAPLPRTTDRAPSAPAVQAALSIFVPRATAHISFAVRDGSDQGQFEETAQVKRFVATRASPYEQGKCGRQDHA